MAELWGQRTLANGNRFGMFGSVRWNKFRCLAVRENGVKKQRRAGG